MFGSDEGRLLGRAQHGDMVAFETLVKMRQQRVYSHCYRLIGNAAEAEDLCSETFLRAFQHLGTLRAEPSIIFWLLRVANNLSISILRKHGGFPVLDLEEIRELPSDTALPEEEVIAESRREVMRKCLDKLSPKERTAVLMFYLEERPLEDIARVLSCGLAGAKSRIHRARHRLRELMLVEFGDQLPLPIGEEGEK